MRYISRKQDREFHIFCPVFIVFDLFYIYLAHCHSFEGGGVGIGCYPRAAGGINADLSIGEGGFDNKGV